MKGMIKQGFKPQTNIMINNNKELVPDENEIAEMFKTHFENLLNISTRKYTR